MICSQCGAKLPENALFCYECGTRAAAHLCIHCATPLPEDAQFCYICGKKQDAITSINTILPQIDITISLKLTYEITKIERTKIIKTFFRTRSEVEVTPRMPTKVSGTMGMSIVDRSTNNIEQFNVDAQFILSKNIRENTRETSQYPISMGHTEEYYYQCDYNSLIDFLTKKYWMYTDTKELRETLQILNKTLYLGISLTKKRTGIDSYESSYYCSTNAYGVRDYSIDPWFKLQLTK